MDFMLRIPRWIFFLVLWQAALPFIAGILGDAFFGLSVNDPLSSSWLQRNFELFLFNGFVVMTFVYLWFTAIIIHYSQRMLNSWLLVLPAVPTLLFLSLILIVFITEFMPGGSALFFLEEQIKSFVEARGFDNFIYTGGILLLLTALLACFATIRLTSNRKRDWILVPIQMLFLLFGILWIQPKLKALTLRENIERPEDHFIA